MFADSGHVFQCEEEWQLLEGSESEDSDLEDQNVISRHDIATAPLLTREAHIFTERQGRVAQYGVFGKVLSIQ